MAKKLKTHQATAKRIKLTGSKKLLKRKAGQDHFNSRDRGVRTMGKRRDVTIHETDDKNIRRLLPYSA
ncbi:MAG: 50S ribosomal protein L35 [Candidatus Kerfeldbacteria bacterium]|nr:50S ribosomal protein L35 [Candidatus Kerfeldbacteria bacterium]